MELVRPTEAHLPSYIDALRRGWSADTQRLEAGREALVRIEVDPAAFLAGQFDPEGRAPADRPAGWLDRAAAAELPTVDVGRRVRRKHLAAVAARHAPTRCAFTFGKRRPCRSRIRDRACRQIRLRAAGHATPRTQSIRSAVCRAGGAYGGGRSGKDRASGARHGRARRPCAAVALHPCVEVSG